MKRRFIFWIGLVIAVLLLLCASAGTVLAEKGQPSRSAAEWKADGYTVIDISDAEGATGFIVLRKDVAYLRDGITRSGNTFTLSGSTRTIQEETPRSGNTFTLSGSTRTFQAEPLQKIVDEDPLYCVFCDGKLWFGAKGKSSNGNTLVLENMISQEMGVIPLAAVPYLTDTWIDTGWQEFEKSIDVEGLPLYVHGKVRFYIDHTSVDPSASEPTRHYFKVSADCDLYSFGLKSDEPFTGVTSVGIFGYKSIHLVSIHLELDDFTGEIDWKGDAHLGLQFEIDTMYIVAWYVEDSASEDPDNHVNCSKNNITAKGDAALELAVGPEINSPLPLLPDVAFYLSFGVATKSTPETDRFVPADTKASWHACEQCLHEDLYTRYGPIRGTITFPWDDKPTTIIDTGYKDQVKIFTWYYSATYNEFGEGDCPHFGYRTNVTLTDQHKKPLEKVFVHYYPVPEHFEPYSTAYTDSDGKATIYIPVSGSDPSLLICQMLSPANPEYLIKYDFQIQKSAQVDDLQYEIIIPEKIVRFFNSESGEATDWPENIVFSPFYSRKVTLPDSIPGLPGRIFTGWNTARDGSGKSFTPGTTLVLEDHLDLWAQWELAGDSWYVSFNASGGTKAPGPQIIPRGRNAILTAELPENGTLIFKGWTPDPQHPDLVYQPGDILPYDSTKSVVVLYALWDLSPVPQPIHISFEPNGGQDASLPPDVWFERGTWMQLKSAVAPVGSTYTFRGWSEDPDAEDPEYLAGTSYYFFRDTVLYAIWDNLDVVTLTFLDPLPDPVSGMPTPVSIVPSMSRDVRIPDQIPSKSGRTFTGWNTSDDGSGKSIAPGSVITLQRNTTLWAQWKAAGNDWYVIYDANGGTKAPDAQFIPQGENAVLAKELPERGSFAFRGWAASPDALTAEYQPGDTLPYDSGKNVVVLYALWNLSPEDRPVVISFDANGGQPNTVPHSVSAPKMTWFLLPAKKPIWDAQHEFLGWARSAGPTAPEWKAGHAAIFDQDITLYAVWNARYKVIEGAGSFWTKGSGTSQRFVADGDRKYFRELRVDGLPFAEGVKISSGSTIADISPSAMEKLSSGAHTITFVYMDGQASASFTVLDIPKTGDAGRPLLWLFLIVSGVAGLALLGVTAYTAKRKK